MDPTKPPTRSNRPTPDLARLRAAYRLTESGMEPRPTIDPTFELEYYAADAIFNISMRIGLLSDSCDEQYDLLQARVKTEMEWVRRELRVVSEALRLLLRIESAK